jgi:PAS domain-containing protein
MKIEDLEIFNDMPSLFWVKDEEGRYLWGIRAISRLVGMEIVGKTDYELPWAADADGLRVADKQVLETGKPRFLHEYLTKPGKITLNVCK